MTLLKNQADYVLHAGTSIWMLISGSASRNVDGPAMPTPAQICLRTG